MVIKGRNRMFESLGSNVIFIVIAVVVLIGRVVFQAKKGKSPPPPKEKIPVHFIDEEEDLPKPRPVRKKPKAVPLFSTSLEDSPLSPTKYSFQEAANLQQAPVKTAVPEKKDFSFNLNKLSPMQQAVVMAEILGPPKGMQ